MLSYQLQAFEQPLVPVETATPEPTGAQVLLKIKACGVCHSDLHFWHGEFDLGAGGKLTLADRGLRLPMVLDHEPLGEVMALGPEAEGVAVGDTRLVFPWIGCGACDRCTAGYETDCLTPRTVGVMSPGGYASHILVPHPRYLFDISGIPEAYACTLACAGVTSVAALNKVKAHKLYPDDKVVLIGMGGVGMTALGFALAMLDQEVVVVDKDPEKLSVARQQGAHHAVQAGPEAVVRIKALTGKNQGAGAVVDFVGRNDTGALAVDVLRKGGRYVVVGLHGGSATVPLPFFVLRNLSIVGSLTGLPNEMAQTIELVRSGRVRAVPVATRSFEKLNDTLQDLIAGRIVGRIVLTQPGF